MTRPKETHPAIKSFRVSDDPHKNLLAIQQISARADLLRQESNKKKSVAPKKRQELLDEMSPEELLEEWKRTADSIALINLTKEVISAEKSLRTNRRNWSKSPIEISFDHRKFSPGAKTTFKVLIHIEEGENKGKASARLIDKKTNQTIPGTTVSCSEVGTKIWCTSNEFDLPAGMSAFILEVKYTKTGIATFSNASLLIGS
jgi:hypothetical protein